MKADWRETLSVAFDRPLPAAEEAKDPYAFDPTAPAIILDFATPPEPPPENEYRWLALDAAGEPLGEFWTIPLAAEGLAHILYPGHAQIVRGNTTSRLRAKRLSRLCEAQNWRCCYCYGVMRLPVECLPQAPDMATLEHLHRQTDGGGGRLDNLVAACASCNSHRGAFTPLKWWKVRQRLLPVWPACTTMTEAARYNLRGYGPLRAG